MQQKTAQAAIQFMARVQLSGNEVAAWQQVVNELGAIAENQGQAPKLAEVPDQPELPTAG